MLWRMNTRLLPALGLASLLLAGCTPQPHGAAVTEDVCRHQADQIFEMRHPEARYDQDTYVSSLRDAPFSTSGSPSVPTQGLGDAYEHGQLMQDCLQGTHGAGPTPAPPPLAAPGGQP